MKLVGIDYGRRRIGVAVTDESGEFIRGLPTIDRDKIPHYIQALRSLIEAEKPGLVVIGLPLDINSDETVMSKEIRVFASDLKQAVSVPIRFVDESLSSIQAAEILRFRKKKDRRNKEAVDRIAACVILESFKKGLTCD
jgi:putative holliday junction resolvase